MSKMEEGVVASLVGGSVRDTAGTSPPLPLPVAAGGGCGRRYPDVV